MKRIFTFCAAVAMLAACAKEAPKTPSANGLSTPVESNEPVAVQFKSNVVATVAAKAQGSFDNWNGNQTLYIYGFQRQGKMDYTATPLMNNETPDVNPKPAPENVLTITKTGESGDLIPYYYQGNNTYDFFGYYIDDLVPAPQQKADGVYVPVVLTGGEDIMLAAADPKTDAGTKLADYRYAYSAYAARRDVHPTLNFKHQLVQFNFKIESGYKKFTESGHENPALIVKGLTIKARNKADLCVAGKTTGFTNIDNTLAELELRSLVNGELKEMEEYIVPDREATVTEESKVIGHSLMVIPNVPSTDDTYDIVLTMVYDGETVTQEAKIKFSEVKDAVAEQTQFTAGYAYEVAIKVYGLEPIEITATMDEWKAGGRVFIDTDVPPTIWDENGNVVVPEEDDEEEPVNPAPTPSYVVTAQDGTEITVYKAEGEAPAVGDKAAPDGEFLMTDGSTIVIAEGQITEIRPAVVPEPDDEEQGA